MTITDPDWQDVIRRSEILGAELNTDYRVLALTLGPGGGGEWPGAEADALLQLLLFPVGEFAASLRRRGDDALEVLEFRAEQLPQIIALFERGMPVEDPLPDSRPNRGEWGPKLSLQGNSPAPDGRSRHLWLALEDDDLRLDLHATFDEALLREDRGSGLV